MAAVQDAISQAAFIMDGRENDLRKVSPRRAASQLSTLLVESLQLHPQVLIRVIPFLAQEQFRMVLL